MAIAHELSWSVSRAGLLDTCARAYYYNYYGSWRGWERGAAPARRDAYLLKKLTRLPMHAGDCLHRALADWFEERRRGTTRDADWIAERALTALRAGWVESRDRADEWRRRPSKSVRLAEHHYGEPEAEEPGPAREYGSRYVERLRAAARAFTELDALAPVREAEPDTWLGCEELGTIELLGLKVYAVPDFAFRTDGEDAAWIVDWKSGRPREQDAFQLALYALYARETWGLDPTRVRCLDVYLPTGEVVEQRYDQAAFDATLARIEASMARVRELHYDADAEDGDPEAFPLIPAGSASARECERCNYRALCGR